MKKDNRIHIKDKTGTTYYIILLSCIALYVYLIFFVFYDVLSFKTNFCESCSGPLRLINDPIPSIIFATLLISTSVIFPKIFRNDYAEFSEKGKVIREIMFENGDIYYGQVKDTNDGYTIPHGKGILKDKEGIEKKGIWKLGILQKKIK